MLNLWLTRLLAQRLTNFGVQPLKVIAYSPAWIPITDTTPPCNVPGCGAAGIHDGLCGPHWWERCESGTTTRTPPTALIAEQIDQFVPVDVALTPSDMARILRDADPRWRWSDKLATAIPRVLRDANTRAGYRAEPHPVYDAADGAKPPPFWFTGRRWRKTGAWKIRPLFLGDA